MQHIVPPGDEIDQRSRTARSKDVALRAILVPAAPKSTHPTLRLRLSKTSIACDRSGSRVRTPARRRKAAVEPHHRVCSKAYRSGISCKLLQRPSDGPTRLAWKRHAAQPLLGPTRPFVAVPARALLCDPWRSTTPFCRTEKSCLRNHLRNLGAAERARCTRRFQTASQGQVYPRMPRNRSSSQNITRLPHLYVRLWVEFQRCSRVVECAGAGLGVLGWDGSDAPNGGFRCFSTGSETGLSLSHLSRSPPSTTSAGVFASCAQAPSELRAKAQGWDGVMTRRRQQEHKRRRGGALAPDNNASVKHPLGALTPRSGHGSPSTHQRVS